MAGVDILTISELMGHTTIQMTKRYAHLAPAHNQDAVDRLLSYQVTPPASQEPETPVEPSATTSATDVQSAEAALAVVVQ
jgi:hypothetical protein